MSITFAIIVYKGGEIKMKTILVTGGTTFVSRYVAEYYLKKVTRSMFLTEIQRLKVTVLY